MLSNQHQQAFVEHVHTLYHEQQLSLVDGYAPFCKYVEPATVASAHHYNVRNHTGTSSSPTFAM